eukprot:363826-Chlamydomonas_euryale.AAC.5
MAVNNGVNPIYACMQAGIQLACTSQVREGNKHQPCTHGLKARDCIYHACMGHMDTEDAYICAYMQAGRPAGRKAGRQAEAVDKVQERPTNGHAPCHATKAAQLCHQTRAPHHAICGACLRPGSLNPAGLAKVGMLDAPWAQLHVPFICHAVSLPVSRALPTRPRSPPLLPPFKKYHCQWKCKSTQMPTQWTSIKNVHASDDAHAPVLAPCTCALVTAGAWGRNATMPWMCATPGHGRRGQPCLPCSHTPC